MKNEIPLSRYEDYLKCPKYCQFNVGQSTGKKFSKLNNVFNVLLKDIYLAQAKHRKPHWDEVRSLIDPLLGPAYLTDETTLTDYYHNSKKVMESLRIFYTNYYSSSPDTALSNIKLSVPVPYSQANITGNIDALQVGLETKVLVEISEKFQTQAEFFNSFSVRAKLWMLSKESVEINTLLSINTSFPYLKFFLTDLRPYSNLIPSIEKTIIFTTGAIMNNIYYPSVTDMCNKCPYKTICRW